MLLHQFEGLTQVVLDALLVIDVGAGADPLDDPAPLVARRLGPGQVPSVRAVEASEAVLALEGLARSTGEPPEFQAAPEVVGVEDRLPVPAPVAILAGEVEPPAIEILDLTVGPGGPDDLGHRLGQEAEPTLGLGPVRLGPPPIQVDPAERMRVAADEPDEDGDQRADLDRRPVSLVEQPGLSGEDRQAIDDDRRQDRHRQELPGHQAARPFAGERVHQPPARPRQEHAHRQREHADRGMQRHLMIDGQAHEFPDPVQVADQGRARQHRGDQGQGLRRPVLAIGGDQRQGHAQQREVERGRRVHPVLEERTELVGRGAKEELIDPQVDARGVLEPGQAADRRDGDREADRPTTDGATVADRPERQPPQDERQRGVRLHRDHAGQHALQVFEVQRPAEQDDRPERDRKRGEGPRHDGPAMEEGRLSHRRGTSRGRWPVPRLEASFPLLAVDRRGPIRSDRETMILL